MRSHRPEPPTLSQGARTKVTSAVELLKAEGFATTASPSGTPLDASAFLAALELPAFLSKMDRTLVEQLGIGLEALIRTRIRHQGLFYQVCLALKLALDVTDDEIAHRIGQATHEVLSFSRSWITKNVRAGRVVSEFPELADIRDSERLYILSRLPRKILAKNLRADGSLGGVDIRRANRAALNQQVRELLGKNAYSNEELLRQQLTELALQMRRVSEKLPENDDNLSIIKSKLQALERDIRFGSQRNGLTMRKENRKESNEVLPEKEQDAA